MRLNFVIFTAGAFVCGDLEFLGILMFVDGDVCFV